MLSCCAASCCAGFDQEFDQRVAQSDLARYRRHGPRRMTLRLVEAIAAGGVRGKSVLDIGGGAGMMQHELVARGADQTTDVDASAAYLAAAQEEATVRRYRQRASYRQGDFVALADQVEAADIVTMDRVVCCYRDMRELVGAAAQHAKQQIGVVMPRYTLFARSMLRMFNAMRRWQGSAFRSYAHQSKHVEKIIGGHGFICSFRSRGLLWQVLVFRRRDDATA